MGYDYGNGEVSRGLETTDGWLSSLLRSNEICSTVENRFASSATIQNTYTQITMSFAHLPRSSIQHFLDKCDC
jgi:hypothetical protein